MLIYSLISQALHIAVWIIVLIGSVVLLRRGYASTAISMVFGAAITVFMAVVSLSFTAGLASGWLRGSDPSTTWMMVGLASVVGLFLFAIGFLQLALTIRREG